jgi:cytochrome o ubiquinol oxidase subunit 3
MSQTNLPKHAEQLADKTSFGFWVYLMTDLVLFATLFATYAVLHTSTFGGPGARELFSMPFVLTETLLLLTSSFTVGMALLAAKAGHKRQVFVWLAITFALGAAFLGMELHEFNALVAEGHSWRASGFLSAFFTLVGTHGAHITAGLIWIAIMATRIMEQGITSHNLRRITLLSLFWHFLDIVWIFIFTLVYLMGAA